MDELRAKVFLFDTFFVTAVENNEQGALFSGNLKGVASKTYTKLYSRLQARAPAAAALCAGARAGPDSCNCCSALSRRIRSRTSTSFSS